MYYRMTFSVYNLKQWRVQAYVNAKEAYMHNVLIWNPSIVDIPLILENVHILAHICNSTMLSLCLILSGT